MAVTVALEQPTSAGQHSFGAGRDEVRESASEAANLPRAEHVVRGPGHGAENPLLIAGDRYDARLGRRAATAAVARTSRSLLIDPV